MKKKIQQTIKKHVKLPSMQRIKKTSPYFLHLTLQHSEHPSDSLELTVFGDVWSYQQFNHLSTTVQYLEDIYIYNEPEQC